MINENAMYTQMHCVQETGLVIREMRTNVKEDRIRESSICEEIN